MAGEKTGLVCGITCKPKVAGTNTQKVWEARAAEGGWFVKLDPATTTADVIGVDFLATDNTTVFGRLISSTGDGDTFRVGVETQGVYGFAQGGGTGAFTAATHFGQFMKADANGKLVVDTAATAGNVYLLGGTQPRPAVAWQFPVQK